MGFTPSRNIVRRSLIKAIKDNISKSNGYNNDLFDVTDIITPVEKMIGFPFVQIFFIDEDYSTSESGKHSAGILEKECNIAIDIWGQETDDPQLWRDLIIGDFEKLFGTEYMLPNILDVSQHTARDVRIIKNVSFGGNVNQPKVGVGINIKIYYGQKIDHPDILS